MSSFQPYPKSQQLARGERRYRRKIASPKQWQAIIAAKQGPCRVCADPASNGHLHGLIQFHHLVSREDGGDDLADNIVPVCADCHSRITRRDPAACLTLLGNLTPAELAYMNAKGGPDYSVRAYGVPA